MSYSIISYDTNFSVMIEDGYYVYLVDASSNDIDISLDDISLYDGVAFLFIRLDSSINVVTINPYSGQLIDGSSTKLLSVADKSIEIISYGQNWISHK